MNSGMSSPQSLPNVNLGRTLSNISSPGGEMTPRAVTPHEPSAAVVE